MEIYSVQVKCFLLRTYFVQKGHCIYDTSRRLMDHITWWNLFFHMPCQSRFVGFLIVPLQLAREHDSMLIDVLAVHCMHKKHLICFYKTLCLSGFHPTAHLHITECFNFLLPYLGISRLTLLYLFCFSQMTCRYLLPLSRHVWGHLEHLYMHRCSKETD